MANSKKIKVHRRVIRMIFPLIQRAKNDRSAGKVLPVYDNALMGAGLHGENVLPRLNYGLDVLTLSNTEIKSLINIINGS